MQLCWELYYLQNNMNMHYEWDIRSFNWGNAMKSEQYLESQPASGQMDNPTDVNNLINSIQIEQQDSLNSDFSKCLRPAIIG